MAKIGFEWHKWTIAKIHPFCSDNAAAMTKQYRTLLLGLGREVLFVLKLMLQSVMMLCVVYLSLVVKKWWTSATQLVNTNCSEDMKLEQHMY